jgi:hypothetical protein
MENDLLWQAKALGQLFEMAGDACAGDREIDDRPGAEPAVVVDDVENLEPALVRELVAHEVESDQRCIGRSGSCAATRSRRGSWTVLSTSPNRHFSDSLFSGSGYGGGNGGSTRFV